jgi:DivIVA domain-containing protein
MPDDPHMVSIATNSSANPDDIARRTFPTARRGVDADAVRRYLEAVAQEMRELLDRDATMRRRLADAERRAAEPVLDEATLTRAVGSETARILQTAHDAARDVVARAEERAAELHAQAAAVLEERTSAAEAGAAVLLGAAAEQAAARTERAAGEAARLTTEATAEVAAVTHAAQQDAVVLLDSTKQECRQIVRQARELRKRVLEDLAERRHGLYVQLEQLRTGRDVLVEVVGAVGAAVDDVKERLANAEHDARVAAAEAGERADVGDDNSGLEAELAEHELQLIGDLEESEPDSSLLYDRETDLADVTDAELALALAVDEGLAGELVGTQPGGMGEAVEEADENEVRAQENAASHRSVDELFARIRASRSAEAVPAPPTIESGDAEQSGDAAAEPSDWPAVVAHLDEPPESERPETSPADSAAVAAHLDEPPEASAADSPTVAGDLDEPPEASVIGEKAAVPDSGKLEDAPVTLHEAILNESDEQPGDEEAGAHPSQPLDADAAAMARRTELLAPLMTRLGRTLKRALQDDQNELLDAIRHASGAPNLDRLLPIDQQRDRLERAVAPVLTECWSAGRPWLAATVATENGDGSGSAVISDDEPEPHATVFGGALAGELSAELTGLLRHRLSESLGELGDLGDGAQDVAGAAYREWKGPRIEALAGDFAVRAFSSGAVAAAEGVAVRWVMDDDGHPCPDCDDNALAGEQPAGEPFPTGQRHPPVHPGCRCLLVAVRG